MSNWQAEIVELHDFFEAWFLGTDVDFDRVESVLAPEFTIVGPDGEVEDRAATIGFLRDAYGSDDELNMITSDYRLLHEGRDTLVASYVETHLRGEKRWRRRSTVTFAREAKAVNGLVWVRVHETWIDRPG